MKIILTGGGSGGHFYPLIAITEALRDVAKEKKILQPKIYYFAPNPYNKGILFDNEIEFKKIYSGKIRRYFSFLNIIDILKTTLGFFHTFFKVFSIFPDVIISKGGFMSLPVVISGKILGIPIIIHESDSVPGRANLFAGKLATKIALSFSEASEFFEKEKTAFTGNPIRSEILNPIKEGAKEYLKLEEGIPTILVLGGSIGAKLINNILIDALPKLLLNYQIIHQTGKLNYEDTITTSKIAISDENLKKRYHPFDYLNALALRMSAGISDLVISRGGSTIFEIASWGCPSIIIPITDSNGDHQRKNSYNYARSGACIVIEENNLTPEILTAEIERIINNPEIASFMKKRALSFAKTDASYTIAKEVIKIALKHEK